MRSRNGNRPLLLAVCAVSCTLSLHADAYLIGYRAVTRDAVLISEQLSVSHAMQPCHGSPGDAFTFYADDDAPLEALLTRHNDAFLEYLQSLPLHLVHHEKVTDHQSRSQTVLRLPPRCFTVDFNDGLVKIAPLQ